MKFPNLVRSYREMIGLTREQLAQCVGVTRQTIGLIESGRVNPGTSVAIDIAKVLKCTVEDLFDPHHHLMVHLETGVDVLNATGQRVVVSNVNGEWVAKTLSDSTVRSLPASGVVDGTQRTNGMTPIRLFQRTSTEDCPLLIAGCDPGLALLSQYIGSIPLGRRRAAWFPRNNAQALQALCNGQTHVAAIHLDDISSNESLSLDIPFPVQIMHFSRAQLGWVVSKGNPTGFVNASDFKDGRIRIINRPEGSGARNLLEEQLAKFDTAPAAVSGYSMTVATHDAVASAVAHGLADVGIAHATAAINYNLTFLPIRQETTLLVVASEGPDTVFTEPLLNCLQSDRLKRDLSSFGTYDTHAMGQLMKEELSS